MLRVQSWYNALSQLFRTCTLLVNLILRTGITVQSRIDECHHFKDEEMQSVWVKVQISRDLSLPSQSSEI